MVTLARVRGQTLTPDISGGLGVLMQSFGTPDTRATAARQQQLQQMRLNAIQGALGALGGGTMSPAAPGAGTPSTAPTPGAATPGINPNAPGPSGQPLSQALNRASMELSLVAPDVSRTFEAARAANDTRTQAAIKAAADEGARNAAFIKRQSPEQRQAAFRTVAADLMRQGKTQQAQRWIDMSNKPVDQQNLDIEKILIGRRAVDKLSEPLTPIAQLEEDFRSGRISREQRDAQIEAARGREGMASAVTRTIGTGQDMLAFKVLPSGDVEVTDANNRRLEGDELQAALQRARQSDLEMARTKEGEKAAGRSAINLAQEAAQQLQGIRQSLPLYDEARELVVAGAGTGPIEQFLPSFKAASQALDNVQNRLGLNVVQNTTFGSLSGPELRFALSSALPTGLDGPELVAWIDRKRAAQQKLANYLQRATIFLGTPGNTVADWERLQRETREELRGGNGQTRTRIKVDSEGNIIQ